MHRGILFFLLLSSSSFLSAQSITPYALNNGGGYSTSMEWNIGESVSIANFIASGYSSSWLLNNPEIVKKYSGKRRGDSYDKDAFWNLKISYSQILKLRR